MKIPQSTTHFLLVLEAVLLVIVLVLCVIRPWAVPTKNDFGSNDTVSENGTGDTEGVQNSENAIGSGDTQGETPAEPIELAFSEEVLEKVASMTLEQKVAQMFIISPEALTDTDKVTMMGNTTRNAINEYPVGGLVYSSINFQGKAQTASMLNGVQEHCMTQLGIPMFLVIEEKGGQADSPLASMNQYNIEASASEIAATGDVQNTIDAVKKISKYLKEEGFNMNLAPNADLAARADDAYDNNTYSADSSVAAMMVAETISTYGEQGILTVISMFPGKSSGAFMSESKADWEQSNRLVYKAGMDAGADAVMVGNVYASAFTGGNTILCSMSEDVVNYLRKDMQYAGVLISDSLSEGIITSNYTSAEAAVAVISVGMDMVYCPENFKEAYQGVLDAVADGDISQETIDKAVARILTCKETIEVQ